MVKTPSQITGPYVHIGCIPSFAGVESIYPEDLGLSPFADGAKSRVITGSIFDDTDWAMHDAMTESWQTDADSLYPGQEGADPKVTDFCRFAAIKGSGAFTLCTIELGPTTNRDGSTYLCVDRSAGYQYWAEHPNLL